MSNVSDDEKEAFFADVNDACKKAIWCALATVRGDQPRVRIVHPTWEGDVLWVATGPDTPKAKQLADNPFVDRPGALPEIFAYGFRNIWRLSVDRQTGMVWVGDVGQDLWEEIDIVHRGGNYGWNLREGLHPFGPGGSDPSPNHIEPIWEYHHETGKSITGGHVYRGTSAPQLQGAYLYADYVSGRIWALWYDAQSEQVTANRAIRQTGSPVITFGEDDQGEQYFSDRAGGIFKFAPPANSAP